jgi:hypothetical protein
MILNIKNRDRFVGTEFWNGCFLCTKADETDTNYRFQFVDKRTSTLRYIWIEVSRIGHYNSIEQEWEYRLNYPKCGYHSITAKWFEDYKNVMDTFGGALKKQF